MAIQITNSLTKKKEEFIPLKGKVVKMYSCGVTVYDRCHIGHARSLYIFDVIRRYLRFRGYDVHFVRNITDIDDKIIEKANELSQSFEEVIKNNIDAYRNDLKSLDISEADIEPRATENIQDMVDHIKTLMDKGMAYEADGDVYFNVRQFKEYGKLSGQSIEKMQDAVRIELDEKKNDPLDFALWKNSKDGEPHWSSPWGEGRPGWHMECSTMSLKHLNCETLDIHAGGRDLIFPHHENEIAQSESLTQKPFAKYWIHHGLLTINGQKMAKSLGNFITIQGALKKYSVDDLKFFYLTSHYASPIDFSDNKMKEIQKQKKIFSDFINKSQTWRLYDGKERASVTDKNLKKIEKCIQRFQSAMDDDFNTPEALAAMFNLVDLGSQFISSDKEDAFRKIVKELNQYFDLFGLSFGSSVELPKEIESLLKEREKARKSKDFKKADQIRDEIKTKYSLAAVDTASGVAFIQEEA